MRSLTDCPDSHVGEWNFNLFGIPVSVKVWFWISLAILSGAQTPPTLLIWVAACFVSILLHEMGHVLAFRIFGADSEIVLYGWGGMAVPARGLFQTTPRLVVSLAGPVAGFTFGAIILAFASSIGWQSHHGVHVFVPWVLVYPAGTAWVNQPWLTHVYTALNDLLYINLYWGLVNLLPIYPLDGGHAARALFEQRDPRTGRRNSLVLSAAAAGAAALWGLAQHSIYLFILFAVLAVSSLQAIEAVRSSHLRPNYWR